MPSQSSKNVMELMVMTTLTPQLPLTVMQNLLPPMAHHLHPNEPAASYGEPQPSYGEPAPAYGAEEASLPDLTPIIIGILALVGLSLLFPTFVSVSSRKKRSAAEYADPM